MHISVAKFGGEENVLTIEICSDLSLKDLKCVIQSESQFGIKAEEMNLFYEGKLLLDDTKTVEQFQFHDFDLIICERINSSIESTTMSPRHADPRDPRQLFEMLRSNCSMLQQVRRNSPEAADAVQRDDFNEFVRLISVRSPEVQQQMELNRLAQLDPFDPEVQRQIHEIITMKNVQENMEHAVEHAPEVFGHVAMLYINCKVNGHTVKAFVDSGAQMTIMSQICAERCAIMRLIDRRFAGIAKGVGTQKIVGRIHLTQLEIEKHYFSTSLSVLEDQPMDMLLGLDMLRRHQCILDLNRNLLRIGQTVETNFLPESELPSHARFTDNVSNIDDNRSTSTIDQQTISSFSSELIEMITKNGFTREQAIQELKLTNGDATKALISLMTKSLPIQKRKR